MRCGCPWPTTRAPTRTSSCPPRACRPSTPARERSLPLSPKGGPLRRLRQQHLFREDEVGAVVVRQLEVVPHRDGVEGARRLAVAAEDALREVDLVDGGVALAGGDAVVGRVLRG